MLALANLSTGAVLTCMLALLAIPNLIDALAYEGNTHSAPLPRPACSANAGGQT
jgi:predicted cobalt transporter CbtA